MCELNRPQSTMLRSNTIFLLPLFFLPTCFFSHAAASDSANSAVAERPRRPFSRIYAFGDSFTDTGNTHSTTGPYSFGYVSGPPYGTTFFHHSTNRYSDGRLVVDFLAADLSLPFLPPYLDRSADFSHGVNFAVAGSTAIEHEFYEKNNVSIDITPQSIMTELRWFDEHLAAAGCKERGAPACRAATSDALFWVGEIGANDYAYSYTSSSLSPDVIRQLAIKNVNSFVEGLILRGAKYIMVQGLPLTGCLPLTLTLAPSNDRDDIGCSAIVNRQTYSHNDLLQQKLQELRRKYPHAIISYADYFAAHRAVMKNPAAYGFAEPLKACCGSGGGPYNFNFFATCGSPNVTRACSQPSKFVNWDGVHLTEAMYKVVADMFFHRGYCKPTFDALLNAKSTQES